jgi:hypothetical protein
MNTDTETVPAASVNQSRRIDQPVAPAKKQAVAICDHGWTRRRSSAALIGEIARFLSRGDFFRSIDRRRAA